MKDRNTALNWNGCLLKGQKIENEPNFIKLCSFRANNACLGPVAPKKVVKDPSGHHQWILLLCINWLTWKKRSGFPLTSSNRKKNSWNAHSRANMLDQGQVWEGIPPDLAIFDLRIGFYGSKTPRYHSSNRLWYSINILDPVSILAY